MVKPITSSNHQAVINELVEAQHIPVETAKARREKIIQEKNEYSEFSNLLSELGQSSSKLATRQSFTKLKAESSDGQVLEAEVDATAKPGNYELEVKSMAKADKYLEAGFPDKNETPVGFGYIGIEDSNGNVNDITIKPGSTLQDVANEINSSQSDTVATIVNTGQEEDPYRLLVKSKATGQESRIEIDPDTTFLNFENLKRGQNLELSFDDIDVTRDTNSFNDLVEGVNMKIKQAAPGQKINLNISEDVDKTLEGIKEFTDKYNKILNFASQPSEGNPSFLSTSSTARSTIRNLQREIVGGDAFTNSKYGTLAEIGITTNAKTGELQVDETKLKSALAKDYQGVAEIFTQSEKGSGLATKLSDAVRYMQRSGTGAVALRQQAMEKQLATQDQEIERKEMRAAEQEQKIRQTFQQLDEHMSQLHQQSGVLQSQLGSATIPGS